MSDAPARDDATELIAPTSAPPHSKPRGFVVEVLDGPSAGTTVRSSGPRLTIGTFPSNDLPLDDTAVSRVHCEIALDPSAFGAKGRDADLKVHGPALWVRDLDSKNGTTLDGMRIHQAEARDGSVIRVGRTSLRVLFSGPIASSWPVSDRTSFGSLAGHSAAIRASFALLERASESDVTVLLEGETGTGKEEAARSLHAASARRSGPFVVVDCGALPEELIERELFGHEKGAFTGAVDRRPGAFEAANGGTIFLDEIGELPLALQPTLLRALERREVRRIGATSYQRVDARVVAATNRDLRTEVNSGAFRPDLYFRLAVLRVVLPPLRERPEDVPPLVHTLLGSAPNGAPSSFGKPLSPDVARLLTDPAYLAVLAASAWPGNVRELRNHLERCLVMGRALPVAPPERDPKTQIEVDVSIPFREARQVVLDAFERAYLEALLRLHGGNISQAARASGIGRVSLYSLLHRHKLK